MYFLLSNLANQLPFKGQKGTIIHQIFLSIKGQFKIEKT